MTLRVKVAEVDELPPGMGKTIQVGGREVTVYNLEGRFVASGTWARHVSAPDTSTCEMPGHKFAVGLEDSPDRLHSDELHYQVSVQHGGVFVLLEEGHTHPGGEPRERSAGRRRRRSP